MTDAQVWGLVAGVVAILWLVLRFAHLERQAKRRAAARELLHRERMAAFEKDLLPPEEPLLEEAPAGKGLPYHAAVLGLGLLLLFAGIGAMIGLRLVPRTPEMLGMQELASLGLIPALAGAGLVLYWYLLRRTERQDW